MSVRASADRVARPQCALGEARAGGRGAVCGVDRRRTAPSAGVPGYSRGQEFAGGGPRGAGRNAEKSKSRKVERETQKHGTWKCQSVKSAARGGLISGPDLA